MDGQGRAVVRAWTARFRGRAVIIRGRDMVGSPDSLAEFIPALTAASAPHRGKEQNKLSEV